MLIYSNRAANNDTELHSGESAMPVHNGQNKTGVRFVYIQTFMLLLRAAQLCETGILSHFPSRTNVVHPKNPPTYAHTHPHTIRETKSIKPGTPPRRARVRQE